MADPKKTEIRIIRSKVGALHLAQSKPRVLAEGLQIGVNGQMLSFSVPVVEKGPQAGTALPDSAQSESMIVDTVDGYVAGATGKNLARLVANGEIVVSGARLPDLGAWKSRPQLLREQQTA